jgi:hypothetical protein
VRVYVCARERKKERKKERKRERERESTVHIVAIPCFLGTLNHRTRAMDGPFILQSIFFTVILSCCWYQLRNKMGCQKRRLLTKKHKLKLCTMKLVLGMLQARHTSSAVLIGNIIHGIKKVLLLERCERVFGLRLLSKISDKANGM